ncbi:dehydrogenase [Porphyromonas crevioricanis]|uniref:Bifunctional NAD(P)H-hydrate repair enzyme n=2 Tax=Porphyromonas crevioricanis TaxID=393921 RepID=A0A0A2FGM4_9PORP|nr:bifunctional ADP-dependent NAD(P)H-hydrate dehydratase/NAD(P)H-hydrate epimerase [Porphyromonas crevioricanis]KGN89190.1 dehydrogenase [Porphyromonas crevioricanis]SJZ99767.1 NAD(P)H-hydrate epimerase [Porphyromonas crevioricanis]SQH72451.1 Nicotinamide nucleotide repair protein [Porphyromonas crevioricanis]GAD05199.1 NAD(P)HX epimerase / NAD(P)HX dehydratase [Porphyromonas crevioricanis JCM 15906]GAD06467.1 NAD(P)HX epimerase / NAD(P)HX dehydratase [Porphyromonas crevioricanis JCM 13913]
MIPIFTSAEIAELDRRTMEEEGIDHARLVERAAEAFVVHYRQRYTPARRVYVFAGPGNNGADALAIARHLLAEGYAVHCFLFNPSLRLSEACRVHREKLVEMPLHRLTEVKDAFAPPEIEPDAVVLDGLFGTGLDRPLTGGYARLVTYLNSLDATRVSIDIPSGLFAEDNSLHAEQAIVRAKETITFEQPKLCMLLAESAAYVGEFIVAHIGLSERAKVDMRSRYLMMRPEDAARLLVERHRFDHKGVYGHGLIVAGSRGMMGAACLAAKAALRSGIGKLSLHVPGCGYAIAQTAVPEAMCREDRDPDYITHCLPESWLTAVGVGPGLGSYPEAETMLQKLMEQYRDPMVIDADAINLLGQYRHLLSFIPPNSILTPHPGELQRLTCYCETGYEQLNQAQAFAMRHQTYVILKGAFSACCMPDGHIVFNSTGNPGMATAGSGDVLFGVILGLLASGYTPGTAALLGNYLHGLAGDCYVAEHSAESLIASDLIAYIGQAYKQIRNYKE